MRRSDLDRSAPGSPLRMLFDLPERREASVAKQIRDYLESVGFKLMVADPGRARLRGLNAGIPDIMTVLPGGRLLAVEVKRPGAKPRKNEAKQNEMIDWLRARGALVVRVRSVLEIRGVVEAEAAYAGRE